MNTYKYRLRKKYSDKRITTRHTIVPYSIVNVCSVGLSRKRDEILSFRNVIAWREAVIYILRSFISCSYYIIKST